MNTSANIRSTTLRWKAPLLLLAALWISATAEGQVCRYRCTLAVGAAPCSIDFAPDGSLWVFHADGNIVRYSPESVGIEVASESSDDDSGINDPSGISPEMHRRDPGVTDGRVIARQQRAFPFLLRRTRTRFGFEVFLPGGESASESGIARDPLPIRVVTSGTSPSSSSARFDDPARVRAQGALLDSAGEVWHPGTPTSLVRIPGAIAVTHLSRGGDVSNDRWGALVADQIVVCDGHSQELTRSSAHGRADGFLNEATDLLWWNNYLVVCDSGNHRLQLFAADGEWMRQWGRHAALPREGEGAFHYPIRLALHPAPSPRTTAVDPEDTASSATDSATDNATDSAPSATGPALLAVLEEMENRVQVFELYDIEVADRVVPNNSQDLHIGRYFAADETLLATTQEHDSRVLLYDLRRADPIQVGAFGGWGTGVGEFRSPRALLLEADQDRLWVADNGNRRLQTLALGHPCEVIRFDPYRMRAATSIDLVKLWSARNLTDMPPIIADIERGPDGALVLLGENGFVYEFDSEWKLINSGEVATSGSSFTYHAGSQRWGLIDPVERQLCIYGDFRSKGGGARVPLRTLALKGQPWGVAATGAGDWWITDREGGQVWKVSVDATVADPAWGGSGVGALEFHKPTDIVATTIDGQERLIVCDHGNHRGQVVDTAGQFLRAFGSPTFVRAANLAPNNGATRDGEPRKEEQPRER